MLILVQALTTPVILQALAVTALAVEAKVLWGLAKPAARLASISYKRLAEMHRTLPRRRIANPLKGSTTAASMSWRYAIRLDRVQRRNTDVELTQEEVLGNADQGTSAILVAAVMGVVVMLVVVAPVPSLSLG